ncbi:AI-2E family transporter [Empedobacter stercoris]|uniref:AI-2E family transporter n=1 Tax=Empedobacter stercoris TaxID=1628248 RepID=UPI001CE1A2AF|nr:AI-2E family transporter [Empedobacter stercoris]MCA4782813.1 AI-2E family transporter [Empedobacter stercoris]
MNSQKHYLSNNILLQLAFISVILLVFGLISKNLLAFFPGFLGALCLYVLLLNPLQWLVKVKKWNKLVSVILLMISSAILIIGPLYLLIQMLTNKVMVLLNDTVQIKKDVNKIIEMLQTKFHIDVFSATNIEKITQVGGKLLEKTLNASMGMTVQLGVAFLILYFMLMNHQKLENWFYSAIPFKTSNLKRMNTDLKDLVISNAIGMPLTAFIQAVIAYIGYLIFGVDDAFTWFVLTIFAAMLPVVGAALIYVPLALFLLASGETGHAIGLLIYCFVVVGLSDNLIRLVLQKKMADVHPLITIFGVIVGLNLFGFIGIIFGPILFSVFFWLVKLYRYEFIDPNPEDN